MHLVESTKQERNFHFFRRTYNGNMKPGKDAEEALDAWCKKFKPRWRKAA